jgi:hypothetical protein
VTASFSRRTLLHGLSNNESKLGPPEGISYRGIYVVNVRYTPQSLAASCTCGTALSYYRHLTSFTINTWWKDISATSGCRLRYLKQHPWIFYINGIWSHANSWQDMATLVTSDHCVKRNLEWHKEHKCGKVSYPIWLTSVPTFSKKKKNHACIKWPRIE